MYNDIWQFMGVTFHIILIGAVLVNIIKELRK